MFKLPLRPKLTLCIIKIQSQNDSESFLQRNKKAANFALFSWIWSLFLTQVTGLMTTRVLCYHNVMKGNVRKHCCLTVDISALNKIQRKALLILKMDFSLIRNCYGKVLILKKKTSRSKCLSWLKFHNTEGVCTGSFWKDDILAKDQSLFSGKFLFY